MKKIALFLTLGLLLSLTAGCSLLKPMPATPDPAPSVTTTPETTAETTEVPTEAPTQAPTEAPTTVPSGPQPMDLVGSWQRTHTEVEGDRNKNTKATITVSGDSETSLTITYKDKEFSDSNFKNKSLTIQEGELYTGCGNDLWYADVSSTGKESYSLTLLEDGTLMLQCTFDFDGMPMVSTQWFARS